MAELSLDEADRWHVNLSGWEKLGSLRRNDPSFANASVVSVQRLDKLREAIRGIRVPGTSVPGRIALGTWRTGRIADFVAVYRDQPGYLIELEGEDLERIVISSPPVPELEALR